MIQIVAINVSIGCTNLFLFISITISILNIQNYYINNLYHPHPSTAPAAVTNYLAGGYVASIQHLVTAFFRCIDLN